MQFSDLTFRGFLGLGGIRCLSYLPQIIRIIRDENGASAISYTTWFTWILAHLATASYAVFNIGDTISRPSASSMHFSVPWSCSDGVEASAAPQQNGASPISTNAYFEKASAHEARCTLRNQTSNGTTTAPGRLTDAIRTRLSRWAKTSVPLRRTDIEPIDEFHIRGRAATLELAHRLSIPAGASVLDIGSGLGGPARTVAAEFDCHVTGSTSRETSAKWRERCRAGWDLSDRVRSFKATPPN